MAAPTITSTPTVSRDGLTYTVANPTTSGDPVDTWSYQWQLDAVDLIGSTSATYTRTDIGGVLRCEVTATNASGSDSAFSETNTIKSYAEANAVLPEHVFDAYPDFPNGDVAVTGKDRDFGHSADTGTERNGNFSLGHSGTLTVVETDAGVCPSGYEFPTAGTSYCQYIPPEVPSYPFTIELDVKTPSSLAIGVFFRTFNAGNGHGVFVQTRADGALRAGLITAGSANWVPNVAGVFSADTWHRLTIVVSTAKAEVWVDGKKHVDATSPSLATINSDVRYRFGEGAVAVANLKISHSVPTDDEDILGRHAGPPAHLGVARGGILRQVGERAVSTYYQAVRGIGETLSFSLIDLDKDTGGGFVATGFTPAAAGDDDFLPEFDGAGDYRVRIEADDGTDTSDPITSDTITYAAPSARGRSGIGRLTTDTTLWTDLGKRTGAPSAASQPYPFVIDYDDADLATIQANADIAEGRGSPYVLNRESTGGTPSYSGNHHFENSNRGDTPSIFDRYSTNVYADLASAAAQNVDVTMGLWSRDWNGTNQLATGDATRMARMRARLDQMAELDAKQDAWFVELFLSTTEVAALTEAALLTRIQDKVTAVEALGVEYGMPVILFFSPQAVNTSGAEEDLTETLCDDILGWLFETKRKTCLWYHTTATSWDNTTGVDKIVQKYMDASEGSSGSASVTLDDVTAAGTAAAEVDASASVTLDDVTTAGTAAADVDASADVTLDDVTAAGTTVADIDASASITLDDVTADATGAVATEGEAAITLDDVTADGAATVGTAASASVTIDDVTLSAAGEVTAEGSADIALDDVTAAGTAAPDGPQGSADITLDDVTADATGEVAVDGSAGVTLDDVTASGSATAGTVGSADITLDDVTADATGSVAVAGSADVTLDAVTVTGAGAVEVEGAAAITLDDVTVAATVSTGATLTFAQGNALIPSHHFDSYPDFPNGEKARDGKRRDFGHTANTGLLAEEGFRGLSFSGAGGAVEQAGYSASSYVLECAGDDTISHNPGTATLTFPCVIQFWAKADASSPGGQYLFQSRDNSSGAAVELVVGSSGFLRLRTTSNGSSYATIGSDTATGLFDTSWHHYALVLGASTWSVEQDGVEVITAATPTPPTLDGVVANRWGEACDLVADLRIYQATLPTTAERAAIAAGPPAHLGIARNPILRQVDERFVPTRYQFVRGATETLTYSLVDLDRDTGGGFSGTGYSGAAGGDDDLLPKQTGAGDYRVRMLANDGTTDSAEVTSNQLTYVAPPTRGRSGIARLTSSTTLWTELGQRSGSPAKGSQPFPFWIDYEGASGATMQANADAAEAAGAPYIQNREFTGGVNPYSANHHFEDSLRGDTTSIFDDYAADVYADLATATSHNANVTVGLWSRDWNGTSQLTTGDATRMARMRARLDQMATLDSKQDAWFVELYLDVTEVAALSEAALLTRIQNKVAAIESLATEYSMPAILFFSPQAVNPSGPHEDLTATLCDDILDWLFTTGRQTCIWYHPITGATWDDTTGVDQVVQSYMDASAGASGAAAITLDDVTAAGTAEVDAGILASADITLDDVVAAGDAEVDAKASADIAIDSVTAAGTAESDVEASAEITIDDVTVSATVGAIPGIDAAAAITLDDVVAAGAAEVDVEASAAITLHDVSAGGDVVRTALFPDELIPSGAFVSQLTP